jgi:phospholipase/carboxylesterase
MRTASEVHAIELLPGTFPVKQLFILLHGVGATSSDLLPFAQQLSQAFPHAAFLLPDAPFPFDGGSAGRQWFSIRGITEQNRVSRVAEAMPALLALVRQAQNRFSVLQSDTALLGFSQGAIMALEFSIANDGVVGRVLAFSGRFASLPEKAPELTTLHLFHGEDDQVIPVALAYAAHERLAEISGDATLDVASSIGHEAHHALIDCAIHRLQTHIPIRSWKKALGSVSE